MQKTHTHAKPVQLQTLKLCKHVVRPRVPKGKKSRLETAISRRSVEAVVGAGPGQLSRGGRAGTKSRHPGQRPTVPRTRGEQLSRGPQTPRFSQRPEAQTFFPPPLRGYGP